ncbi:DUF2306 domain-containing protein [Caulobacter sp. KR2-114]|uniref:DUF2306 domain-containing protein n=1 Tax=Caulobacter sp. KR2-114 TaxID=3400912 RepID=UPI003C0B41C8
MTLTVSSARSPADRTPADGAPADGAPANRIKPARPPLSIAGAAGRVTLAAGGLVLAAGAAAMLTGHAPHLARLAAASPVVQAHLAAAVAALALGAVLMGGVKGVRWHRRLGWTWAALMLAVAGTSLFIGGFANGRFGPIHALSGLVLTLTPLGVAAARRHAVARHRRTMSGLFVGGLVIAGLFAFAPGRLLWQVFLG